MEAMKLVLAVTLAIISTTTAVDLTREPGTNGRDVVQACIAIITQPRIFSEDQQLLRRIAYVETRDGTNPDTYAGNNNGGIWQLSETKYLATKTVNQQLLQDIATHFNIDWTATVWSDLRKPLFSALAARLYFEVLTAEIPLSPDISAQGNYWATYYTSSGGTQTEFVNAIDELTDIEACDISGIDLYFVMDESGSVGPENFDIMKDFVYNIADSFEIGPNDVQIGVMTYSGSYTFHFVLNTYMNKSQVLSAIQSLPYSGGGTNTADALHAIRLQAFTELNGTRSSEFAIPRVAIVITDGKSSNFDETVASANLLHDAGVITFAIGIGGANEAELDEIASEPNNKDFVSSFDVQRLRALQVSISQRACEASPDLTIGENITGVLQENKTQYLNYPIPESGGITLQVNVNQGTIVLYASSVIQTPNEAFHDIKIVTNSYEDVFINPNNLSDPNAGTVFIALTSASDSSSNTTTVVVNTQPGDVSTEPVDVTITGLQSQDLGGIVTIECTATGKPQPTVEWKKDGVTLSLNVVNTATRDDNTIISTLTTSLASSDAGMYMCIGSNVIQNVVFNDTAILNLEVTGRFITPHFGNQLGGTPVLIRGLFDELVIISCVFGTIETRGVRISETQAMCISPRLDFAGPVEFNVFLNDVLIPINGVRFYAQHYSDLADVTVDPKDLIVSPGQKLNINWVASSLLPTADSDINVDIILHEVAVTFNKTIRWIGEYVVERDLSNDGSAVITIPRKLIRSSSSFDEFSSSYSLILIQIAVSTSSMSSNRYWMALKELKQTIDTHVTVGRWTHVLFRRYANDAPPLTHIDSFLCSNWLNSYSSHFLPDSNDLDPCPCNRLQAQLPQSGFTPRITPGKKIIDEFLHGNEIVCYEPRSTNDEDAGNGIHIVSQECCYNRQGNLLVGGPFGGSANAQPSSAWENHFVFDLSPFISCCVMNARYTEYYEKRPSDNCSRYEPFNAGWMGGDPHLLTLDGHQYTFNGRGEFILIETRDDRFTLQGRMIPAENDDGTESLGTVFSAIVAKQYDSDVVEFRASVFGVLVFINGLEIEIEVSLPEAYNSVIVSNKGNDTYSATFSTGVYLEVMQRNGFLSTIVVSLLPTYFDLTQGLMGVYNDDPSDDLLPRNSSTPLPLNSSLEKVHYEFGLTWILSDSSQSLFSYDDSSSDFSSFYDPTFTPAFSPQFNNSELEEQANLLCQDDFECLFDIAATGRVEIGNATLEQQAIIENINEITKPIICNPSCINGVCVANDTCSCFFRYKGDLCNNEDSCAYNANPSPCEDPIVGWFFNSDTEQCQFGGCEGRGNIFTSLADCVKSCGCPSGATPNRQCLLNPCSFSTCRAFPNAQCEVDACDSCISRYTVGLTEVTSMCDASCDPDTERFNCLVDPCDNAYCPNLPDANCLPDYCGGCSARFYDTFGVEVTDTCSECPDDKPQLNCPFNLCDHQKCLNISDADCVFDVCGGCTARFYLGNEEVTDQCMFCEGNGQIFTSSGGTCPEKTCENSGEVICSAVSRPGCDCPEDMVLDMLNNTCVILDDCPCPDCDSLPEECPLGEVFHECRSCPRTCAEQIDQSLCTTVCERGCGCPNGTLLDEEANRCVSVDECPKLDICALPAERGICNGNIKRYFYNSATKICELFQYGGCFGNENNFFTLHDCEMACSAKPPTCTPTFCAKERRAMCYLPNADQNGCSKDYSVSNCQVCHYSSDLQSFSCDLDCIDDNGEYDDTCLRSWGACLRRSYLHIFRSAPSSERIPENYKCIEYRCN